MKTMKTMNQKALKPMKKFVIREAESLKTTAPAAYGPDCDPW